MKNLYILRREKNITQDQLAELVGTTNAQISRLERGHCEPKVFLLYKIAKALNTTMEHIMGVEPLKGGFKSDE